jgi:hypothetical protein
MILTLLGFMKTLPEYHNFINIYDYMVYFINKNQPFVLLKNSI